MVGYGKTAMGLSRMLGALASRLLLKGRCRRPLCDGSPGWQPPQRFATISRKSPPSPAWQATHPCGRLRRESNITTSEQIHAKLASALALMTIALVMDRKPWQIKRCCTPTCFQNNPSRAEAHRKQCRPECSRVEARALTTRSRMPEQAITIVMSPS